MPKRDLLKHYLLLTDMTVSIPN